MDSSNPASEAVVPPSTSTSSKPAVLPPSAVCLEMSNSHLLKMDTNDAFATQNAIKKLIAQTIPESTGDIDKGEPLFPGLVRLSKNPKSPICYFSFESAETREAAMKLMTANMKHRKQTYWVEVPVTEKDLQMTYRGAASNINNASNAEAAAENNKENGENNNNNTNAPSKTAQKRLLREGDERTSNTAQWAAYPYAVQVNKKASHCKSIIRQIASGRLQKQLSPYGPQVLLEQFSMIESPFQSGYRNHVNFSCGYDAEQRPVIGFVSGAVSDGRVSIEDVTNRWYMSEEDFAAAPPSADPVTGWRPSPSGAALVPVTTNVISVAYARAVMEVVKRYENGVVVDGITYNLGMVDKGSQMQQQLAEKNNNNNMPCDSATDAASADGPSEAKRGPRVEGSAAANAPSSSSSSSVINHPFWRRVQVRHNTVGEVMVDLEMDPSIIPSSLKETIQQDLIATLAKVESTYDGIAAEAEEEAFALFRANKAKAKRDNELLALGITKEVIDAAKDETRKPESHRLISTVRRPNALVVPKARLVSLQWHFHTGTTMCPHEAPRETIYGDSTLVENLCGMKFLLSPPSFFQVNTPTTEKMLERVAEVANLKPTTTLLDLCCGTGIIGICLSKFVKKIVGIEMVVSAVENAKVNAANNGVTEKTTYYAAKVEDALNRAMATLTMEEKEDIVAIFDPPRAGMHPSVLCAVRAMPQIRRIVYISCDQAALIRDCPSLMKEPTKKFRGTPYVIEKTFGIDLFPHTPHVEMVAVLNKVSQEAMNKYYEVEASYRSKETVGAAATASAAPADDDAEAEDDNKEEEETATATAAAASE